MAHEKSIKEALEPILPACLQIKKAEAERVEKEQNEIKRKREQELMAIKAIEALSGKTLKPNTQS
jgi:hypothetical protein